MAQTFLKIGDKGEAVRRWQEFLVAKMYLKEADGVFGKWTDLATKAFQADCGLRDDGIVGAQTVKAAIEKGFKLDNQPDEIQTGIPGLNFLTDGARKYKISKAGINLIHSFEELRLCCYDDGYGFPTIGWGHLVKKGEPWRLGDKITQADADALFLKDLAQFEEAVNRLVKAPLYQCQYDALVSLCFNLGEGNFSRSALLEFVNNRKYAQAADSFKFYVKAAGKVSRGLVRRRRAEKALFLGGK